MTVAFLRPAAAPPAKAATVRPRANDAMTAKTVPITSHTAMTKPVPIWAETLLRQACLVKS